MQFHRDQEAEEDEIQVTLEDAFPDGTPYTQGQ